MYTILGAGLSGLSTADHLEKKEIPYQLFEAKSHGGGHIHSEVVDGFVWDEGPHVSFTKHAAVREYFENNLSGAFLEYPPKPANYYKHNWIPHPAQSNLYAIPQELRERCISGLIEMRNTLPEDFKPANYQEWIDFAFGKTFSDTFAKVYTEKYWTTPPSALTTDWIGKRVYFPEIKGMVESARGPLDTQTHYISTVRYPEKGGFYSYIKNVEKQLNISYNKLVSYISFGKRLIEFNDGTSVNFTSLISTIPLPQFIVNSDAPSDIKDQALKLHCSQVLIVNVIASHPSPVDHHWIYVYDEEFYTTRVNFTELLAPENGIPGQTGIQVEVYFSAYRPIDRPIEEIVARVLEELVLMELISSPESILSYHHKWIEFANVIFDDVRRDAQHKVFTWLESQGMVREADDLEPMTDWDNKEDSPLGDIILAGRFAQWKYYWTDDCVMRGQYIAKSIKTQQTTKDEK